MMNANAVLRRTRGQGWRHLVVAAACLLGANTLEAQQAKARNTFELGIGASHFQTYLVDPGQGLRRTGFVLDARLGSTATRVGLNLAASSIQQPNDGFAPRLDVIHFAMDWKFPGNDTERIAIRPTLGGAHLRVDAREIECGDFPLCSEWSPWDTKLWAGVAGLGVSARMGGRLVLHGTMLIYRPFGEWQAANSPETLREARLTVNTRLW